MSLSQRKKGEAVFSGMKGESLSDDNSVAWRGEGGCRGQRIEAVGGLCVLLDAHWIDQ